MQFLIGASYAALHSFISYLVPVEVADIQTVISTVEAASPTGGSSWWPYILGALSQANVASPEQSTYPSLMFQNFFLLYHVFGSQNFHDEHYSNFRVNIAN